MFLMFLVCSGLIWLINNLSESYISNSTFHLEYVNVPDSLMLTSASKSKVDVKVQASGFQFLGFNIKNRKVKIDISSANKKKGKYFIDQNVYRKQIDKQLRTMTLLEIDRDTLFFEFTQMGSKEVPVSSRIKIKPPQNYMLDGPLKIEPEIIIVRGPKTSIDSIDEVSTVEAEFPETTSNFVHKVELFKPTMLKNTSYSTNTVVIRGKVAKFSEKIIEVPIQVINLPREMQIRTFPDKVPVLCRAKIDDLKNLDSDRFQVVADYDSIKADSSKILTLELLKRPENLQSAQLTENQVEYILKRQ